MASLLAAMADTSLEPRAVPLQLGQIVADKYRVLAPIGAGGMGVVYLARDLRLDRDVALKLGSVASPAALARLEREAQALARLSHPNVVVVHEVGEVAKRLFVAMEYVRGGTLRDWLAAGRRGWRAIVAIYVAAGDGLAAAHAAGLVHRDFKPENVLIGEGGDERPRVADFGLARGALARTPIDDEPGELARERIGVAITRTGALVGTPAYMAPEQHERAEVDARADQFAYCTALWEALHGQRPFAGETVPALLESIERALLRGASEGHAQRVPGHILRALRRGLHARPDARWPAMAPLLAELRRDPSRTRRSLALLGVVLTATIVAVSWPRDPAATPCSAEDGRMHALWNPERAAELERSFTAAHGAATFAMLRERLDDYAAAWTEASRSACEATHVHGVQSGALLDRRMLCLQQALATAQAILDEADRGGRAAVELAPGQLAALPDVGECADVRAFSGQAPLPADPERRAEIESTALTLASARVASGASDAHDPAARGDALVALAEHAAWPPLVAQASYLRAMLLADHGAGLAQVEPALADAAARALAAGDERTAALAMANLGGVLATTSNVASRSWIGLARGLWERLGRPPLLGQHIAVNDALRAQLAGELDEALRLLDEEARLAVAAAGDTPYVRAQSLFSRSSGLAAAGRLQEAVEAARGARDGVAEVLGPDHPVTGQYTIELANFLAALGQLELAEREAERAIAIAKAWYGPSARLADALSAKGDVALARGDVEAGRAAFAEALAMRRALSGDDSPQTANLTIRLGMMAAHAGDLRTALDRGEAGLAELERLGVEEPPLDALILLGYATRGLGRMQESIGYLERAVAQASRAARDHPETVNPRIELAYSLIAADRAAEAVDVLEPAVALARASPHVRPPIVAEVHLALAKALWAARDDEPRALAQAELAQDGFAALGPSYAGQAQEAATFLHAHR
jgi:eukaryotic-like serine/threonine-protein kinase